MLRTLVAVVTQAEKKTPPHATLPSTRLQKIVAHQNVASYLGAIQNTTQRRFFSHIIIAEYVVIVPEAISLYKKNYIYCFLVVVA